MPSPKWESSCHRDVHGFIARDDSRKEIIVALRGSASVTDMIINAQVLLVPFEFPGVKLPSGTRVHSGFLVAWDSIGAEVVHAVDKQLSEHPGYSIVTTGHSLGGSLALLAAVSLQQIFKTTLLRAYSYGAPRTGNKIFSDYVNATFGEDAHRVVHGNDGVPTIIPRQLGYHHHGIEYWLYTTPHSEETTMKCDPEGEDPNGSASIPSQGVNLAHTTYFGILVGTPFCF
ncbi:Alpha/Beta hydrolase protein [Pholiota molesta]|nr:Alpha/Beta hydrolase protein [Pholiota molesta]